MSRDRLLRAAWATIDLDAITHNLDRLRARSPALRAVVKADAYGHGAPAVAHHLEAKGVDRFAVALVEEGMELRRCGVGGDILVMDAAAAEHPGEMARHGLAALVSSPTTLRSWLDRSAGDAPQAVHLKVNTGMNRLGLRPDELAGALAAVRSAPGLKLVGLMSHLAEASNPEAASLERQHGLFAELVQLLSADERRRMEIHIAPSAAALHGDPGPCTIVRPGLALLGYDPARRDTGLRPALSITSRVTQVLELEAGDSVGYDGIWSAAGPARIGVIPVGYADGYPWRLGGHGEVLFDSGRAPLAGVVSMDLVSVDLTATPVREGDEATLLGYRAGLGISAVDLADGAGTSPYEILCGFGRRLPRLYIGGEAQEPVVEGGKGS